MKKVSQVWIILIGLLCASCGVRGNPTPLSQPPTLGRGRPTYDKGIDELLKKQKASEEAAEIENEEQKKNKK